MRDSVKSSKQLDDSLDIPAEVDFRGGEQGRYAHRFGEVLHDEELAAAFLRGKGFQVESISPDRFAKTPDFRLMKQGKVVAFCEVKTFECDVWLEKMLTTTQAGELVGGLRSDPIYNRISNVIHSAAQQLASVNQNHEVFNILVLMNRDKQAKYEDLVSVISGQWDPLTGIHDKTHEQFSEGRVQKEKRKIDLYVWLDVDKGNMPKIKGFFLGCFENRSEVCSLFGINPEAVTTIS